MKNIFPIILLFTGFIMNAQSYIGLDTDNYSGLHGVIKNPGNIADSRTKIDINLVSFSGILATDYTSLTLENINTLLGDEGLEGIERFASPQNEILLNVDVLGPSFMFSLDEKQSIGLISRVRVASNFNNISGELFEGLYHGFPTTDFSFDQSNLDFTTHAWGEIGVAYGRVLIPEATNNFLKGGVTLKYLLGGGAAQGSSSSLQGNYQAATEQVNLAGDFSYALTYDDDQDAEEYFSEIVPGFGADIGLVYEYRTNDSQAASNNDNIRAFNQYKFKVGVSVTDIGAITYKDVETTDYAVNGNVSDQDLENDFTAALEDNFATTAGRSDIKVSLPTTLNLNFDYHLHKKFYLNLDVNQSLVKKDNFFNNNRLNLITFTPRYESRILGAYLPISYSGIGKTAMGFGFRVGPLMLGSGTIISNLISSKAQTANVFLGLKVPFNHKNKN